MLVALCIEGDGARAVAQPAASVVTAKYEEYS
jgi:hypothetical protein